MKESLPDDESQRSFEDIMDRYGSFLHNTIARLCPKNLGLQFNDIEQEARLRLWRALESEREITSVGSYTYRIAVSVTVNAIRRIKSRREEQLDSVEQGDEPGAGLQLLSAEAGDSPESLLERKELIEKIEHALSKLAENRQLAVGLYLKGMTTEEIGELMGWSEPKARNLAYRGLKDLRDELRAEGIDYDG
jgi:RNA polymerase sigma factor (sigma-70 family)